MHKNNWSKPFVEAVPTIVASVFFIGPEHQTDGQIFLSLLPWRPLAAARCPFPTRRTSLTPTCINHREFGFHFSVERVSSDSLMRGKKLHFFPLLSRFLLPLRRAMLVRRCDGGAWPQGGEVGRCAEEKVTAETTKSHY